MSETPHERYVCIHGHFYQPPRENPWLEAVEMQDSAHPYHDWNERITAECYAPNALSRILDAEQRIVEIVNNYAKISFNFGPTLLSWLETSAPDVYAAILQADRQSRDAHAGHGSALAQPYNHMILPLATRRDKQTQVRWGIRDFEQRFGRAPEGMWLPETAVDFETLEVLSANGIRFTILSPHQAQRMRGLSARTWTEVPGGSIDPSRAYEARLPSGGKIALFFYDAPVSRAVAFEQLLNSGETFARRLTGALSGARTWPQLVHVATDGETYGHHHRFGDMALAYALRHVEAEGSARLTNYAEYLERHPPRHVVEIVENTSWSCAHGVERWRSDCGCSSGAHQGWRQAWRGPLRQAFDWLRSEIDPAYEQRGRDLLRDPWAARDAYIDVVLDRSREGVDRFLAAHASRPLAPEERTTALELLGMQRHAQLMYTSCGWFFDDVAGIEAVQVLQYAGRALDLAERVFGRSLEGPFLERLEKARSNLGDPRSGREVYERLVRPAAAGPLRIGAHHAIASLFPDGHGERVYGFAVDGHDARVLEAGPARLAVGRARVMTLSTEESVALDFGVLHMGGHNVTAGVRHFAGEEAHTLMARELADAFERADFSQVLRGLDRHFGGSLHSLGSLLRDEQRRILGRILASDLAEAGEEYQRLYERSEPMMRFLTSLRIPLPRGLQAAAEVVLNRRLLTTLSAERPDPERVRRLLEKARLGGVRLDADTLGFTLARTIDALAAACAAEPTSLARLERLADAVAVARTLPFEISLWKAQNGYFERLLEVLPGMRARAQEGDGEARAWIELFLTLGEQLGVRAPDEAAVTTR